jgi:transcription elongation GreA/GreB family factor
VKTDLCTKSKEIEAQVANNVSNLRAYVDNLKEKLQEEQEIYRRASAQGDRSENAEWQISKDKIAQLTVSIMSGTSMLDTYEKYKASYQHTGRVMLGATVKVRDKALDAQLYLKLYPPGLGNAKIGALSIATPLGLAILGKTAGAEVTVKAPSGDIVYIVEEVL